MNFTHYPLGTVQAGRIVQVVLKGAEANVRLVDDVNLSAYRNGRNHRYIGGHYRVSPVQLQVPWTGSWHVVVDLGGFAGQVSSSVSVL